MDELCAEWQPEPLCGPLTEAQRKFEPPVISRWVSHITSSITMGQEDICTDLASPAWSRSCFNAQKSAIIELQIAWKCLTASLFFALTPHQTGAADTRLCKNFVFVYAVLLGCMLWQMARRRSTWCPSTSWGWQGTPPSRCFFLH